MPHWLNPLNASFRRQRAQHTSPESSLPSLSDTLPLRTRLQSPLSNPPSNHTTLEPSSAYGTPVVEIRSDKTTLQIIVSRLTLSSPIPKKDIRVSVCISDVSKLTCPGELSKDGLTVTWKHPFLFTVLPSNAVVIAVWALPEKLTGDWDRQPMGDQIVTNVASLLRLGGRWQCNLPGAHDGYKILHMACIASNVPVTLDGHDCVPALQSYAKRLSNFRRQFKNISAVSTQIETWQAVLDLCPEGHMKHTDILRGLANSFRARYNLEGNISDLHRAIELYHSRLDFCPSGHPDHAHALGGLVLSLWEQYMIQGNEVDLDKLIEMAQKRLDMCPSGHPQHIGALGHLGTFLWNHYNVHGDIADLNRAIDIQQECLDLHPLDHPEYHQALGNLAISLATRYHKQHNLVDLDKAINLQEKELALCPSGHPSHALALENLAKSLSDHYEVVKTSSDSIRAIKLFKEALGIYPVQHKSFPKVVKLLAQTILLLNTLKSSPPPQATQPFTQVQEAFETYALLKTCAPAVSVNLWNASQTWVRDAENHEHPSVLDAYRTTLDTLDRFTSMPSSLGSRHEMMQAKVADLANNAFSCAIRHADFAMAIELLEQGRGILWNQLARVDISLDMLEGQGNIGKELGNKFARLSAKLKKHAGGTGDGVDSYWRVKEEWHSVVDEIRRQDGLSRFLLHPRFEDLRRAAELGPMIIVNASKYTCDALIVLHTQPPIHIRLDCSLDDVTQLCSRFSELIRHPHAYGECRELWIKRSLRELWMFVVEPIVAALQNDVQLPLNSRIWWCPASKFTILPLHAAGPYRKDKKNLMDLYISSYAPSLSALIRARERARTQKMAIVSSGNANVISFAAVGQAQPSADQKLRELPEVECEIQKIRKETDMRQDVAFETVTGEAASIEGAVQAFREHRWVHLACHGAQHATKPFESWFAMSDGPLTLMRIIRERYTHSEFAFLSACHTAVGDESTPDEVLHLAAGMQFAGFNGVIGTLWQVDDSIAHEVVTRFYREMFRYPVIDFEKAAEVLNVAATESAKEVPLEKRIVFVHIGV